MKPFFFSFLLAVLLQLPVPSLSQPIAAPGFSLPDIEGNTLALASYTGKVVVLYFWGMYSQPSREALPAFVELRSLYQSQGVEILTICLDRDLARIKNFAQEQCLKVPIILPTRSVLRAFGDISAVPTSIILDWQLNIIEKRVGFAEREYFENWIKKLLKAREEAGYIAP